MHGPGAKIVFNFALFALLLLVSCSIMFWWLGGGSENLRDFGFARAFTIKVAPMFATMVVAIIGTDAGLSSAYKYPKNVIIFVLIAAVVGGGLFAYFSLGGLHVAIPFVAPFFIAAITVLAIRLVRNSGLQAR